MEKSQIAFITGTAKGMGKAIVDRFLKEGYKVVATDIQFKDECQDKNLQVF